MKTQEQIEERLKLAREEVPQILNEINNAKEQYNNDRRWYGSDANLGYLEQMRVDLKLTRSEIRILEWVLLDSQTSAPTAKKEKP